MAQTILYYPTIDIQDGAWLRNAILYWDEVSSIVPYENYPDFSPEILYLQDLGVYKPVYPRDLFDSEFAEDFRKSIVKRISAYEARANKHETQNCRVRMHRKKIYVPALRDLIHYGKLLPQLLDYLENKSCISDCGADGWMEIDSKIAQIYMRTLAEYSIKCSDKDIVLGADTVTHSREIYPPSRSTDLRAQCCKINIENCLPQPSMDVSFEDILEFKNRRKDELNAFRAKIRELERSIYHADSPELIRHYEAQFIEGWQQSTRDFHKVLKEARIGFFLSGMAISVATPFVSQRLAACIGRGMTPEAIQTGAQLLSVGNAYVDYRNKISPAKSDGGFSYIIKANKAGIIRI